MAIFGNIFEEEKDEQGGGVAVTSAQASQSGSLFGDIFAEEKTAKQRQVEEQTSNLEAEKEPAKKGFFSKALDAGKKVTKLGLDAINLVNRGAEKAINVVAEPLSRTKFISEAAAGLEAMDRGEVQGSTFAYFGEELLKGLENPILTTLNTKPAQATIRTVSEKTSNIPLKTMARIQSIGSQTYEEAYAAWLAERNDPNNPVWQQFLYELQDTGVQTAIGALLAVGTAAATRNPQAGYAVSGAFYTALSADEQLQEKGKVDSLGNIAIDVVGDQMLNKLLVNVFGHASKGAIVNTLKGFGIEGSTEVSQSLLKYANDYGNARTEEEKQKVLDNAKRYITSGGIAMEFAVGGVAGGIITGVTGAVGAASQQPNKATTRPSAGTDEGAAPAREPITSPVEARVEGLDIADARDKLAKFERTADFNDPTNAAIATQLRDILNDYTTAFNDKTIYVPSDVTDAPLIEVETSTFPDGKVAVKFSASTEANSIVGTYDYSQLFSSQEEATKSARDAVIAWAKTQIEANPEQRAQYEKIIDYAENPRAPIAPETAEAETRAVIREVPLAEVESGLDAAIESRINKNDKKIKELEASFERGDAVPAIPVFINEAGKYVLNKDGAHRLQALKNLGRETVRVQVQEKTTKTATAKQTEERAKAEQEKKQKEVSTEPKKKDEEPVVKQDIQEKKTKKPAKKAAAKASVHTPVRELGGEKVVTPTVRTIYKDPTRTFKSKYGKKAFITNTYVLEFQDRDVEAQSKDMPQDALKTLIEGAEQNKNELGKPVQYLKKFDGTGLVFDTPEGKIIIAANFYNYLAKEYKGMRLVAGNPLRAVAVYDGDNMVGLVMPKMPERNDFETKLVPIEEAKQEFKVSGTASAGIWENGEALLTDDAREKAKLPKQTVDVEMGGLEYVNPIELPELVDLARDLMGNVPSVVKKTGNASGRFYGELNGRIKLVAELFKKGGNHLEAARTLAHEIGHLIDYLPDRTLNRGNVLGRLASLRDFMAQTYSFEQGKALPKEARDKIRKEARGEVAKKLGKRQQDFTDADKKQVAKIYKANLDEALKKGGYILDDTVRNELLTVTRWWHPYDPAKVPTSYKNYRESAVELYAEAISVLFNAPKRLQEMAPTFYNNFFTALDAKPDVRDAYFELQAILSGDRELVVERRRSGVRKMFKDGDYKAIELHNQKVQEKEARRRQYWQHFKHTVIDKNFQIIDRVKKAEREGKVLNPDENPVYFLEERNYIGGKIKAIFEREFNTIYQTLNENQVLWEDFGEMLFYMRIAAGDRSDVANPRGITPDAAQELAKKVAEPYDAKQREILTAQIEKFHAAIKKVSEEAFNAGLYTPELYQQMQENPAYVTFQVLDHLEDGMTSRVYKSLGTLKDIANPADSTMLKIISTIRAAERNKTTKATVDFLLKDFPAEIEEAKYTGSKKGRFPVPSRNPDKKLITYFEQGKIKGYYVDPYIADSLNNESVGQNAPIVPAIRFMNSTLFRPLFISFNLGFQSFNLIRDFVRFYKNIPDMSFARAMKRYGQAGRISRIRAFGLPKNPSGKDLEAAELLNRLEEEKVLSVTFNDLIKGETDADKQVEKILADTGIKDFQPAPRIERVPKFAKPVVKALDKAGILDVTSNILGFIENLGNLIETLPKAAGVYEYTSKSEGGWLSKEQKSYIRRKLGSPDFLAGGTYKPITNEVFLFSNAIIQGIRADLEVMTDPKTRSGYWWKTTKITFLPKILMAAVLMGLLGDEYKELMEGASEYDKTNYIIIPLGRDTNGKPIYLRVPQDETSRFLGGIFWKAMTFASNERSVGQDIMDIASYTGGQLPSISPTIESFSATMQFLAGQNPYDFFRGRPVLSETTFKAGGWDATKAFLGWQFQQLGGGVFYRFYHEPSTPREEGAVERVFNMPLVGNIAGRFIRVSDYGETEQLKAIEKKVEKEKARETIKERDIINKYIEEAQEKNIKFNTISLEQKMVQEIFDGNPKTKDDVEKARRLVKKFRISLKRGEADPNVTALIDANTNEAKIEILKVIQADMTPEEFSTLRNDLIKNKIVSGEVFNTLLRER